MNQRVIYILYLTGTVIALLAAISQKGPGYMDAAYYYAGGLQLAAGKGFWEPFIWNYLTDPSGLPQPSHTYWMPLASILSAIGLWLSQQNDYFWAQAGFILLAGLIPVLTYVIARKMLTNPRNAWIAALLATVPGLYLIYMTLTETFLLYMLGGAFIFVLLKKIQWGDRTANNRLVYFLLGITAGWMHLSRADGLLWLAGIGFWIMAFTPWGEKTKFPVWRITGALALVSLGYFLMMGGWYLRNLAVYQSLTVPGVSKTLWLTEYNQLYAYPAAKISFQNWLQNGIGAHIMAGWHAFRLNIQNLFVVQGSIVLLPVSLIGFWHKRKDRAVMFFILMWMLTLLVMTFVFPYAGPRGGYLHSGAGVQVLIWAMFTVGLEQIAEWGQKVRKLPAQKTFLVFGIAALAVNIGIGSWFFSQRVIGSDVTQPMWNRSVQTYRQVGDYLGSIGYVQNEIVMVNDPPSFFVATGYPCVVIPDGDVSVSLLAAQKFGAKILVLDRNQANLLDLYENPGLSEHLDHLATVAGAHIFRIISDETSRR